MNNTLPQQQPQQDIYILNASDVSKHIAALQNYSDRTRQRVLAATRQQLGRGKLGAVTVGEVLDYLKNRGK